MTEYEPAIERIKSQRQIEPNENRVSGVRSVPESAPSSMLVLIDRYVRDPSIDVEKLERLWAIHREQLTNVALAEFNEAMNLAQAEIQPVARIAENRQTSSFYAKLEHVDKAIRPIYLKHGFSISFNEIPAFAPGNVRIQCRCARGGHVELYSREAPPDVLGPKGTPTKTALHGIGSAETFLKRYITCGIFNVVFRDQDDDGVGGLIEPADCAALRDLIIQVQALDPKRDEAAFCLYMNIPRLADMPKHALTKATSALKQALTAARQQATVQDQPGPVGLPSRPEGSASQTAREGSVTRPPSQPSGRAKPGIRD